MAKQTANAKQKIAVATAARRSALAVPVILDFTSSIMRRHYVTLEPGFRTEPARHVFCQTFFREAKKKNNLISQRPINTPMLTNVGIS